MLGKEVNGLLKKVLLIIFAFVLIAAMCACLFFWSGSFERVLYLGSFSSEALVFFQGQDIYGDEYRVVMEYDWDGSPKLALLTKGKWNTWELSKSVYPSKVTPNPSIGWINSDGLAAAEVADQPVERHKAYCGNDAVKDIQIPEGMLPETVSVEIYQNGQAYVLHLTACTSSQEEVEQWKSLDIIQLLREAGYLSQ